MMSGIRNMLLVYYMITGQILFLQALKTAEEIAQRFKET